MEDTAAVEVGAPELSAVGVFAADGRLQLWNNRFGDLWDLSGEQLANHPRIDRLVKDIAPRLVDASRAGLLGARGLKEAATGPKRRVDDGRRKADASPGNRQAG